MYYAYVHCKPDNIVFYVGKGTLARAKNVRAKRNQHYMRVVEKHGKENISVGVIECSSEKIAFDLEKGIIKCLKMSGIKLTNLTDGGEGNLGRIQTIEEIEKRRKSITGKIRSEETKKRLSIALTGRKHSEDTKKKLSHIFSARPLHQKFLDAQKGRTGKENPHAKVIYGYNPDVGYKKFDTLTLAAEYIDGSVSKVCRSAKSGIRHKGWIFSYTEMCTDGELRYDS